MIYVHSVGKIYWDMGQKLNSLPQYTICFTEGKRKYESREIS